MPGLMREYVDKQLDRAGLETELSSLAARYNNLRGAYLFIYAAAIEKPQIPQMGIIQADYFIIHDILKAKNGHKRLDFYIETPGGSGETVEEIVRFLRKDFETVEFVVSGEAKSAGTLMALSGDDILMTETGSLGPIDAQMRIGRSVISAYDYMEWVNERRNEAAAIGKLNPFDANIVAQITPGELGSVHHSLKFAEDLVEEWLTNYKFKNWNETETRKIPVTLEAKRTRAKEIACELTNHSKWRSHGRSIKIADLESIGLKIKKIDDSPELADIVYRIQTICRLIFYTSNTFKIFATSEERICRNASASPNVPSANAPGVQPVDFANAEVQCPNCKKVHHVYAKFKPVPEADKELQSRGLKPLPKDGKMMCECGNIMDLSKVIADVERQMGKPIVF